MIGISLFTGYGGLDQAVESAVGPVDWAWCSDIKPAAITLLNYRQPDVHNVGDMTSLDLDDHPDGVDLMSFGWPCQPHSAAGKRLGEADPRALWPSVHRIIAALRPRFLFGENVARIATNGELRRVVRTLAALGYVGAWRSVRAADVGAPHRRARLFLFAMRADCATPDAFGQLVRNQPGRSCGTHGAGARVAGDDGPARTARGLTLLPTLLKTPTTNLGSNGGSQHPDKRKLGGHGPTLADEIEWMPFGIYSEAVTRWGHVIGREAPTPTMPSPRPGSPAILAPAFVEWMMGLSQGWVTDVPSLSRSQQLSLLGDGVVPQQGAWAYRLLIQDMLAGLAEGAA
jgi:DNA (cytosine-5)-methyltransferase 1